MTEPLALLRLVRAPNTFTAAADVVAGAALGAAAMGAAAPNPARIVLAALGGALLYAFGAGLNDLVDRKKDQTSAPTRPLPSGRVTLFAARATVAACFVGAVVAVASTGGGPMLMAAAAVLGILLYDVVVKDIDLLAAAALGLARGACLAIGFALATPTWFESTRLLAAAGGYAMLIALLTIVSQLEDRPHTRAARLVRLAALLSGYVAFALAVDRSLNSVLRMTTVGILSITPGLRPGAPLFLVVKAAVFTLPLLSFSICLTVGAKFSALACAAAFVAVFLTARLLAVRES